ncbi:MAG: OmpA family protein [Polyangia bacterium]
MRGPLSFLCALGLFLGLVTPAAAQSQTALDVNRFQPAFGTGRLVTLDLAEVSSTFEVAPQLFLHYAKNPLYVYLGDQPLFPLVGDRLTGDLGISVGIPIRGTGRFQFGVSLPVTFWQNGDAQRFREMFPTHPLAQQLAMSDPKSIGQEDLRLQAKAVFVNGKYGGLGVALDGRFPTGDKGSFLGSPFLTFQARLLAHLNLWRFTFVINPGVFIGQEAKILDTRTGGFQFPWGGGVNLRLYTGERFSWDLMGEAFGTAYIDREKWTFGDFKEAPLEGTVATRFNVETRSSGNFHIYLGAGPGGPVNTNKAIGSPDYRIYGGLVWAWKKKPEKKPPPPEIPPPSDCRCRGGNCPCTPGMNCACTPGVDCPCAPGVDCSCIPGKTCPCEEGKDCACTPGVNCPCVPGVTCPCKPGVDCPRKNIKISGSLFEFDSPNLRDSGRQEILKHIDRLAEHLKSGAKVRIEGHTDNVGAVEYNKRLSHDRAQTVAEFIKTELKSRGVPPEQADAGVVTGWYASQCASQPASKLGVLKKLTPAQKKQRDDENEPNRRVEINLYPDETIKCFVPLPPQQ